MERRGMVVVMLLLLAYVIVVGGLLLLDPLAVSVVERLETFAPGAPGGLVEVALCLGGAAVLLAIAGGLLGAVRGRE